MGSVSSFSLSSGLGSSDRACSTSVVIPLARITDSSLCAVSRPGMSGGVAEERRLRNCDDEGDERFVFGDGKDDDKKHG